MSEWKAKRFWKDVTVNELAEGFSVQLDSRVVKTPLKRVLMVPTTGLAEAIAAEWHSVEEEIDPSRMPFTRSANAAIDKVADQFDEVAALLSAYGDSDLLCYRADGPEGLVDRQAENWDPILAWASQVLGTKLETRVGIMHRAQDAGALEKLDEAVKKHSTFELTAFHDLVSLSGSLILAFAVIHGRILPEQAWGLSRIDEEWQIEQWGEDEEAQEHAALKRESFLHAARFFALSKR